MLEAPSAYFIDQKKWSRKKAAWTVAIAAFLFGIPSALSYGGVDIFSTLSVHFPGSPAPKVGFLDIVDQLFGSLFMMLVVLSTCVYTGWFMNTEALAEEISHGMPSFKTGKIIGIPIYKIWMFMVKFICPVIIGLVILNMFGVFG